MSLSVVRQLAQAGKLYPSVILHGASEEDRRQAAAEIGRTLLCEVEPDLRPCGECRHCKRIDHEGAGSEVFHPDFRVLERDLRTGTSIDATRAFLEHAQVSPFEARGQVFVVASAETLGGGAANALLKTLEEPPTRAPRNFLLLAPSQFDLLPTIRSRSLSVFLGLAQSLDESAVASLSERFTDCLREYSKSGDPALLLAAADRLADAGSWKDPRATEPWSVAAAAVRASLDQLPESADRGRVLALAEQLLEGWRLRLRGIRPQRIIAGLVFRHLASSKG